MTELCEKVLIEQYNKLDKEKQAAAIGFMFGLKADRGQANLAEKEKERQTA